MNKEYRVKIEELQKTGKCFLSVTHNGYQWGSIPIKDPEFEIPLIIQALESALPYETVKVGGKWEEK